MIGNNELETMKLRLLGLIGQNPTCNSDALRKIRQDGWRLSRHSKMAPPNTNRPDF